MIFFFKNLLFVLIFFLFAFSVLLLPNLLCSLLLTLCLICSFFMFLSGGPGHVFTPLWPEYILWMIFVLLNLSRLVCSSACYWWMFLVHMKGTLVVQLCGTTRVLGSLCSSGFCIHTDCLLGFSVEEHLHRVPAIKSCGHVSAVEP